MGRQGLSGNLMDRENKRNARRMLTQIALGKLRVPGRAIGQGIDLKHELNKGVARTAGQDALMSAVTGMFNPRLLPRRPAYRISPAGAVQKFFSLMPDQQRAYLKQFEDRKSR